MVLCGIESHRNELHVFLRILNHEKQENNDDTSDIDTSKLSKEIWSKSGSDVIREILMSAISSLFLSGKKQQPLYLISPWLSDFVLFKNYSQEFSSFFPKFNDKSEILFSDCLGTLAELLPIRIITTKNKTSDPFVSKLRENWSDIEVRIAPETEHKKGLLSPNFYLEGSMNFTYSGVFIRDEIITYHTDKTVGGNQKISKAYIEFNNHWKSIEN